MTLYEELQNLDVNRLAAAVEGVKQNMRTDSEAKAHWERVTTDLPALGALTTIIMRQLYKEMSPADVAKASVSLGVAFSALRGYAVGEQQEANILGIPPNPAA
jgi:hypothetical protein